MPDLLNRLFRRRHRNGDLACREFVEIVTDYLEGALSPAARARFEAHVAACDGCEDYLRQMRETLTLVGTLSTESLSAEAEAELLAAFRGWKSGT